MHGCAHLIALAFSVGSAAAPAARESLPNTLHYTFYMGGQPAGGAEVRVSRTSTSLVFESKTRVMVGDDLVELACRTDADPTTFAVRSFSYTGTKGGTPVASSVYVTPDSVYGTILSRGNTVPKKRIVQKQEVIVFEDWVVELQILLALRQERADRVSTTYRLVFANSFLPTDALAGYTGEVLVEAPGRSITARKLAVAISGGQPFESHVDQRGVPVYLKFPGVGAEIFLDEFFGENPPSHFPAKASSRDDSSAGRGTEDG